MTEAPKREGKEPQPINSKYQGLYELLEELRELKKEINSLLEV